MYSTSLLSYLGNTNWKKYLYFCKYIRMVEIWSTEQYNIFFRNLHEFPALEIFFICPAQEILVIYNSCPLLCLCIAKKLLRKIVINFSISAQWHSDCPKKFGDFLCWSGKFCHFTATAIFWSIQVIPFLVYICTVTHPKSDESSGYSRLAVDPAVFCNRNRPSLMNFPSIWDFPKSMYIYTHKISQNVPNIQNPHRATAEILELHELGTRLLSNPNKYGYCLFLSSTEYSKVCTVGTFLAYKIHSAPILPIFQWIFEFCCVFYLKIHKY